MARMSKDGVNFFDVDDSDDSQAAAKAKGYREYIPMTKNGKDVFNVEASDDSYKAAIGKGYQDVPAYNFTKSARDPLKEKIDDLVSKGGDRDTLERQAVRLGGKYKDGSFGDNMTADAYHLADNALLNVPSWIAKKSQDDKGEAQFDDLKHTIDDNKSTRDKVLDVTGSIGSPLSLLTPGSVAGRVANAAGQAAVNSVARSDDGNEVGDALKGAGVGGGVAAGLESLPVVGKALGWAGKKAGRVLTGVSEGAADRYLANPEAVTTAKPLFEQTKGFLDKADEIGGELSGDSGKAFDMLGQYSASPDYLTQPLMQQAERLDGLGGFGAERKGAIKYLRELANDISDHAGGEPITLDKGKGLLNVLDKKMQVAEKQGADAQTLKAFSDARKSIDSFLKESVPEYGAHMQQLAGDTQALTGLTDKFRTDQGALNTLKRIQSGKDKFSEEALAAFDKKFGTNYGEALKDSFAKDAFTKESTQGSRKTLGGLAIGGVPGMVAGMTIDKFGGAIYKAILDGTMKVGKYAEPLQKLYEQRGPAAVAAAHAALMAQNPDYKQLVEAQQ